MALQLRDHVHIDHEFFDEMVDPGLPEALESEVEDWLNLEEENRLREGDGGWIQPDDGFETVDDVFETDAESIIARDIRMNGYIHYDGDSPDDSENESAGGSIADFVSTIDVFDEFNGYDLDGFEHDLSGLNYDSGEEADDETDDDE